MWFGALCRPRSAAQHHHLPLPVLPSLEHACWGFQRLRPADLTLEKSARLRWYKSSPSAQRGFCGKCGAHLFWQPAHARHISIAAGSLDEPTQLRVTEHIFVAQKGDYYEIADDLPKTQTLRG